MFIYIDDSDAAKYGLDVEACKNTLENKVEELLIEYCGKEGYFDHLKVIDCILGGSTDRNNYDAVDLLEDRILERVERERVTDEDCGNHFAQVLNGEGHYNARGMYESYPIEEL